MSVFSTNVLYRPETLQQRFLPEGPYPYGSNKLSWVAIQHGADATHGSINIFDPAAGTNEGFELTGRPGFAFPTDMPGTFVVGQEKQVGLFDTSTGGWSHFQGDLEPGVDGTVINDGVVFSGGLVFGCKDLNFAESKAGLYLWRRSDRQFIQLRNDQVCTNGKIVTGTGTGTGDQVTLLDIDTPTKTVVRYTLDVAAGTLSEPEIVVDLRERTDFPDGMIATPDAQGVIIAFYNPNDVEFGEACQFSLADGSVQATWTTARSPRVTCPQLVDFNGRIQLVLTTADEGMTPEQQARHVNAGCLFIGETDFDSLPETPVFEIPA